LEFEVVPGGSVTTPQGFLANAISCGFKKEGLLDLALLYSEFDCAAAAVFTQNQVAAAPVLVDRETLAANNSSIRAVVANTGTANACTGAPGVEAARQTQTTAADVLNCHFNQVFVLSTGVIGVPLPMDKMRRGLGQAAQGLDSSKGPVAARAIMTTDTRPKSFALRVPLPGGDVTIGGIAKGAGMIHPNMATMLAIITTDAAVQPALLQELLTEAVQVSFNCISVDGDTSTNDTVLLLANGTSQLDIKDEESQALFSAGLKRVCLELAQMIVRDGEGASKFVKILVSGASEAGQARAIASTIATSPLVKTALAGSDPNWGRIMMAAGRAGVFLDQSRVALKVSNPGQPPLTMVENGTPTAYQEADAVAIFSKVEINLHLDLQLGNVEATMWTTDLSHDYVTINGDYRT